MQSQQYALTIVALEEKLLALADKQELLEKENTTLKEFSKTSGEGVGREGGSMW